MKKDAKKTHSSSDRLPFDPRAYRARVIRSAEGVPPAYAHPERIAKVAEERREAFLNSKYA
jgi:hypothetical protein